jgi:PAS domain S-box-containing protein
MEDIPLYNSALLVTYIDLLQENYPHVNVKQLLDYAKIAPYELEDRGHWFSQKQINRFHENLVRSTGNQHIAHEAGRFAVQSKSSIMLRQYASAFATPAVAYWMLGKLSSALTKHISTKIDNITIHKAVFTVTPNVGVQERPYQCENRVGLYEGLAKLFTGEYAQVEHDECVHQGYPACKYSISWKISAAMIWKLIASYASVLGIVAVVILFFFLPLHSWIDYSLTVALISTACFLTAEKLTANNLNRSVKSQQSVAEQLVNQYEIRYNELALIKEIGEAASSILDPTRLLDFVVDALQKRLQFSRGMIMLANTEKTKLIYATGYGYVPKEEELLKNTDFHLTNPLSRGIFYLAYRDQKPFLINDINDIENNLSQRSANFMKELGVESFICVPIIYEGKSEGILAVDNIKPKRQPMQSDLSLLMGIAPQIGSSLNNALAHKKLKESEERFRNLSDNSPDIIYQLSREGEITYINPAGEELLRNTENSFLDKKFIDFVGEEKREKLSGFLQSIVEYKTTIRDQNFAMLDKKGLPRHITFTGAPDLDTEGNVIGIVGTLKDITKLQSMEAQLMQASKMEAIGTLTGGVAHDFNNILHAITSYNQLLLAGKMGNEKEMFYLNSIEELVQRAVALVRQLLLFSSKKVESLFKAVDINEEIRSMYNLLLKSIPQTIEIRTNLAGDIFPVNADSAQIGQIVMNLIINARDAIGDNGKIAINTKKLILQNETIMSGVNIPRGNYVELAISDTGSGMGRATIQHIFEPFFTTKETGKGTGLGLAVVYGIVKKHDGFIFCDSELNRGTTFTLLFPASLEAKEQRAAKPPQPKPTSNNTETILLVDDEKSILETGRDILISYGYKVMTAENADQAIEIYQAHQEKIHLVISDLSMPGKGGKQCLSDLIAINPRIKVLMTSGYCSPRQVEELITLGAAGFINKPYRSEDLLTSIRKIIDDV